MRSTRLSYALGISLWSAVISVPVPERGRDSWRFFHMTGSQAASTALPEALRAHVKGERFGIVTSIRGLPLGVRDGLQMLFDSRTLDIAEPEEEFQASGVAGDPVLQIRRLAVAGCSTDHCLVYYERGGSARTWRVALFRWTPAATRFEGGGIAPGGLATIDDVRNAVLSGAMKNPNDIW